MTTSTLFCLDCLSYFPQDALSCPICGRTRPVRRRTKPPLTPESQADLPGRPVGLSLLDEQSLLVAWNRRQDEMNQNQSPAELVCFDLHTLAERWTFPLTAPAIGAPLVIGDSILQLIGQRAPSPARLVVLSRAGQHTWSYDFNGPTTPLSTPASSDWAFCAVSDGTVLGIHPARHQVEPFSRFDSTPRLNAPVALRSKTGNLSFLATGTRPGQIIRVAGQQANLLYANPDYAYLTGLNIAEGSLIYASDEFGRLFAIDSFGHSVWQFQAEPVSNRSTRLGEIANTNSALFFGASDHQVRCLNPRSGVLVWQTEVHGSVLAQPQIWNSSLLLCGDTHGCVYGLDLHTGRIIWQVFDPTARRWAVSGNLIIFNELLIFGAHNPEPTGKPAGRIATIPYHAGQHAWAAQIFEAEGKYQEAAEHYVLESRWCKTCDQDAYLEKAAQAWEQDQTPEWGARMWFGVGDRPRAAAGYERAANAWRIRDPARAAFYCLQAAEVLQQNHQPEAAEKARDKAASLAPLPFLRLELATAPTCIQNEVGEITLRIHNTGRSAAQRITIYIGGTLLNPVNFSTDPGQEIAPNRWWDLTFRISPSQAENRIDVCAECFDQPERKEPFRHFFSASLQARPAPLTIKTGDIVKGKIKINNSSGQPIRLEVGDMILTEIEVET